MKLDEKSTVRNLITTFRLVVSALESNSITHGWKKAATTNMGLIAQVVTGMNVKSLDTHLRVSDVSHKYYRNFEYNHHLYSNDASWWLSWVKELWPLSGRPKSLTVIETLSNAGFDRDDIVDFEYLNSPVINERFDEKDLGYTIEPVTETQKKQVRVPIMKKHRRTEEHYRTDWWGRVWGLKQTKVIEWEEEVDFYLEEQEVEVKVDEKEVPAKKNHRNSEHVIAYYKETIKYLEEKLEELESKP